MTLISELMTPKPVTIALSDTIQRAVQLMDELDVDSLPVCESKRLVGMVALGGIATHETQGVQATLRSISAPAQLDRAAA